MILKSIVSIILFISIQGCAVGAIFDIAKASCYPTTGTYCDLTNSGPSK